MAAPTAAQDKLGLAKIESLGSTSGLNVLKSLGLQNVAMVLDANWAGDGWGFIDSHKGLVIVTRQAPGADYNSVPIGSLCVVLHSDDAIVSPYDADLWVKGLLGWSIVQRSYVALVTLTTAQILALQTTAIDLIAAPGSGRILVVDKVVGKHTVAGSPVAFANVAAGDDLQVRYTGGTGAIAATLETTGWLDQTTTGYQIARGSSSVAAVANAKLVAFLGGAIDTGTGTVTLEIHYHVENTF